MTPLQILDLSIIGCFAIFAGIALFKMIRTSRESKRRTELADRVLDKVQRGIWDEEVVQFTSRVLGVTPEQFRLMIPESARRSEPSDTERS